MSSVDIAHPDLPEVLARTLPPRAEEASWDYASAHAWCRELARTHYENFHVGTLLFPPRAREHAFNVYAYCRWSDDLADETGGDTERSLALLAWWRGLLDACFAGEARHPVFVALRETARACELEKEPFARLLDAFEQDQRVFRYETFEDLLGYCRNSADPVGHVVLALLGHRDDHRRALSDRTCTALQLANFWQDVENDLRRGRIYVPLEDMRRFGVNEEDLALPAAGREVRELVRFEVDRTRALFHEGLPLARTMTGRARFDVDLFSRGGIAILDAIARQDFDVLVRRPRLGKVRKLALLGGCVVRGLAGGLRAGAGT